MGFLARAKARHLAARVARCADPLCWLWCLSPMLGPSRRRAHAVTAVKAHAPPSSSGLGHRPFKAAARVRIPLGALVSPQFSASDRYGFLIGHGRSAPRWSIPGRAAVAHRRVSSRRGHGRRQPVMAYPEAGPHHQLPDGIVCLARGTASCARPPRGCASATVDVMRSCRAAWSARHPVKVEVAGSNPVGTAGYSVWTYWVSIQVR